MFLSDFSKGHDNNLNLVRFCLATFVIFSHSFPLSKGEGYTDPFKDVAEFSLGDMAVNAFFVVSGFLVTGSLVRSNSLRQYALARLARIYPGLFLSIFFCVFLVGLLQTTLSTHEYLTDKLTRNFLVKNSLLIPTKMQFTLPGVFDGLPYSSIVNGSLWTLPYEISMYVVIAILGLIGVLKNRLIAGVLLSTPVIIYATSIAESHALRFAAFAAIGILVFIFSTNIPLSNSTCLVAIVLVCVSLTFGMAKVSQVILCGYIVLWLGYVPNGAIRWFNSLGDYSYGMYIYAYPIQQTLVQNFQGISPLELFVSSFALTLPVAIVSWHLVEHKALQWAKKKKSLSAPA
jgi:peptidoglycan/LPS O-acetylase OafA/YrhL